MRVILLLDCSASMTGAALQAMRQGVGLLVHVLAAQSGAMRHSAYLCIIAYESTARTLTPFTAAEALPALPPLEAAGSSGLGGAFRLAAGQLDVQTTRTDTPPALVYLFTDGVPTDDWESGLAALRPRVAAMFGMACGLSPDMEMLTAVTGRAFRVADLSEDALTATFRPFL
jgi:uncharacterized protein YegL